MKPPFTYFGGKTSIAPQIAALLPPHEHYVEPFAGSLAVLLAKRPSATETVNDLDGELVNFWRMLRDHPADLERACALTPHSRAEHQLSMEPTQGLSDIERARRLWVRLTQGRGGQPRQRTGWRFHYAPAGGTAMPGYLAGYVARMPGAAARLAAVSIECQPALNLIEAYGKTPSTLIYADPPYLDDVRTHAPFGDVYNHEMRAPGLHVDLAQALSVCHAAVVLSGYRSPLYDELFGDWHQVEIGAHAGNASDRSRTEVLWSNRPFPHEQLTLAAAAATP